MMTRMAMMTMTAMMMTMMFDDDNERMAVALPSDSRPTMHALQEKGP